MACWPIPRDAGTSRRRFRGCRRGVADVKAALDGARQILMEEFAENAELLAGCEYLWDNAVLHSQLIEVRPRKASFATTSTTGKRSGRFLPSRPGVVPGPQ